MDDPPFPAEAADDVFSPKGMLGDDEEAPAASTPAVLSCYAPDKMSALSDEEEREACGALVTCLDELVQVTGMCRDEEERVGGGGGGGVGKEEDDEEVEDVHSVLSQFYMPPTPRMLTSIDEEDDGVAAGSCCSSTADADGEAMVIASARQCGLPEPRSTSAAEERSRKRRCSEEDALLLQLEEDEEEEESQAKRRRLDEEAEEERQLARMTSARPPRRARDNYLADADYDSSQATQFSCGHASIFGEFQPVVFHSLIASLES